MGWEQQGAYLTRAELDGYAEEQEPGHIPQVGSTPLLPKGFSIQVLLTLWTGLLVVLGGDLCIVMEDVQQHLQPLTTRCNSIPPTFKLSQLFVCRYYKCVLGNKIIPVLKQLIPSKVLMLCLTQSVVTEGYLNQRSHLQDKKPEE